MNRGSSNFADMPSLPQLNTQDIRGKVFKESLVSRNFQSMSNLNTGMVRADNASMRGSRN